MFRKKKKMDLIAIGDVITDLFIKLKDASVNCDVDHDNCKLCMTFGAKLPYEDTYLTPAAGNVGNVSYAGAKLGLNSAVVASVGDDANGKEVLETLKKRGVSSDYVSVQKGIATNYSYMLWFEDERTILRKHEDFKYSLPEFEEPKMIYFSSISKESYPFHDDIAQYAENHPDVMFAFQPGSNEIKLGAEKLARVYKRADIFFCNLEEAKEVLGKPIDEKMEIEDILNQIHALGPKIVVVTDGKKGAFAFDGTDIWKQMPYPDPKPPLERTGAGDAFSSTTAIALLLGNDLPTALGWGAVNSMSVVQHVGGQDGLLEKHQIEEHLKNAPEGFRAEKIS